MKKRVLGRTGLEVSEFALGGGMVGGILILPDEAVRQAALEKIVKAGVNWIDTAAMYGKGASEETLGRLLPRLSPRPRISTKFTVLPEHRADIFGAVAKSLEASLRRMNLQRVDLLQLHNQISDKEDERTISPARVLGAGGVADALDKLKSQRMIGGTGLTAAGEIKAVLKVIDSGCFDTAQVYYNMINPSAAWTRVPSGWASDDLSGLVEACKRNNMGMLNIRVFAGGPLASPQRHGREYIMLPGADLASEDRRAAAVRAALGTQYGTPAQTALRFVLANTDFSCHVVGIADMAQLDEALAAVLMGPLPKEAITKLEMLWASNFGIS
ncbi:MAG TPA: aldo/keto reductase [Xanthobacteraceae bacterium]|nr:aldo/keto reductase [Xanthobacteraceae bacterium]